jgi:Arc/MetJ family transcription regulator
MRMTMNLPDELLAEAMKDSGGATKTAVIVSALEDYVRRKKREELISLKGKIVFADGFDPEALRDQEYDEFGDH